MPPYAQLNMETPSVKKLILAHLSLNGPLWGGQVEDHVRSLVGSKGGTTSRSNPYLISISYERLYKTC